MPKPFKQKKEAFLNWVASNKIVTFEEVVKANFYPSHDELKLKALLRAYCKKGFIKRGSDMRFSIVNKESTTLIIKDNFNGNF
jgi:hypothetical protein